MAPRALLVFAAAFVSFASPGAAQQPAGVQRMYVFDCGQGRAPDQSRWSPGVNVGKPWDMATNCYLIRHAQGYVLWDTGLPDFIAAMPEGRTQAPNAPTWRMAKTLASQLEAVGVKPADVRYVAISHRHNDHVGNLDLFPQAMLLVQRAEYDWRAPVNVVAFKPEQPVTKLDGDHDVFGDGSITIVATPGHTPGHQSLLVKLPKTGAVLLTGDAVHFRDNWEHRRVPEFNVDKERSAASMRRMADVMAEHKAALWINHDKAESDARKRAPEFYE